ncbi:probable cytochrome P450 9f2, partial [Musca vetustissima]|uniref:probable cytochrome P450 9f2 n=1 Tax=Musca vetustissima TaxID=27455 RepID=UPI002AB7AF4E
MLLEIIAFALIAGALFYYWATKNNNFFKERNLEYEEPRFLFGNSWEMLMKRKTGFEFLCEVHQRHKGMVYGAFDMRQPVLMIRDPELVKQILIKDFDHFVNRQVSSSGATENLFSHSLFMMENDKWRDMRSTLSPAFTGSKMRQMFQLMVQTVDEAMAYLRSQQKSIEGIDVDMKDLTTRLTNDIIASTAFGLQVNSFRDKENEFYIKAKRAVSFTGLQQVKMLFIVIFPKLAE